MPESSTHKSANTATAANTLRTAGTPLALGIGAAVPLVTQVTQSGIEYFAPGSGMGPDWNLALPMAVEGAMFGGLVNFAIQNDWLPKDNRSLITTAAFASLNFAGLTTTGEAHSTITSLVTIPIGLLMPIAGMMLQYKFKKFTVAVYAAMATSTAGTIILPKLFELSPEKTLTYAGLAGLAMGGVFAAGELIAANGGPKALYNKIIGDRLSVRGEIDANERVLLARKLDFLMGQYLQRDLIIDKAMEEARSLHDGALVDILEHDEDEVGGLLVHAIYADYIKYKSGKHKPANEIAVEEKHRLQSIGSEIAAAIKTFELRSNPVFNFRKRPEDYKEEQMGALFKELEVIGRKHRLGNTNKAHAHRSEVVRPKVTTHQIK